MKKESTALVILNGEQLEYDSLLALKKDSAITIAADGAADYLFKNKITPDVVIGDMDSFSTIEHYKTKKRTKIISIDDQNTTDGEKALNYCIKNEFKEIRMVGAFGKRLDHSLYNLELLKKFHGRGLNIECYTKTEKVFLLDKTSEITGTPGAFVSLFPIYGDVIGVSLIGLKYEVESQDFKFGRFSSISNELLTDRAIVKIDSGYLLVVISCATKDGKIS